MEQSTNLRKEFFPGEHALDEKIRKAGEKAVLRFKLVEKLYPQTEEEFQQQYQYAQNIMRMHQSESK